MNQESLTKQIASRQKIEESVTTDQKKIVLSNKVGFIDKGSGKHQSNEVFNTDGICPTVPSVSWKQPLKILDDK